jgi:hypothetical protein
MRALRQGDPGQAIDEAVLFNTVPRARSSMRPVLVDTRRWVAAYEVWRAAMASAAYRASVAAESPSEQDTKSAR